MAETRSSMSQERSKTARGSVSFPEPHQGVTPGRKEVRRRLQIHLLFVSSSPERSWPSASAK